MAGHIVLFDGAWIGMWVHSPAQHCPCLSYVCLLLTMVVWAWKGIHKVCFLISWRQGVCIILHYQVTCFFVIIIGYEPDLIVRWCTPYVIKYYGFYGSLLQFIVCVHLRFVVYINCIGLISWTILVELIINELIYMIINDSVRKVIIY